VNVGVAVGAFLTHVAEDRLDVALRAGHGLMHAAEWVPRLVMIKLRDAADRSPPTEGVAILAGDIQRAMRAAGVGVTLRLRPCGRAGGQKQRRHHHNDQNRRTQHAPSNHGFPK